ncbi:hypothetical protein A5643_10030 [Mycobacterium sp. 1274756.6]|nr:hypothetical protein A5643_10030 [Mycobacterium sp. 1274756.6]
MFSGYRLTLRYFPFMQRRAARAFFVSQCQGWRHASFIWKMAFNVRDGERSMGNGTTANSAAATIERILADWPARLEESDLVALSGFSPEQATDLTDRMMAALPAGRLGATEATRLVRLVRVVRALSVTPDPASVAAMRERYERFHRIPATVVRMLGELERLASTTPGILGSGPTLVQTNGDLPEVADANGKLAEPAKPERFFRPEFEDHDISEPLTKGEQYTVAFDVGLEKTWLASGPLPARLFEGGAEAPLNLTVQLSSPDFEILGDACRQLRLPRTGPSKGKARFDVSPLRDGLCQLTATLHYQGNFLTQLRLTAPVGDPGTFDSQTIGRPVDAAAVLEPRDLSLVIRPEGAGYSCIALGSVGFEAPLPLSANDLAVAADAARRELATVVMGVYGGKQAFLDSIDIPANVQREALGRLARAGRRLFQQLFQPAGAGGDVHSIGDWLVEYATDPELQLKLQIFAARVPVPWSMLYLGDVHGGAELDWNHFLGFRHIIEQLPFQSLPGSKSNFIQSQPNLSVGLNINPTIDEEMRINLVAYHQQHWSQIASTRTNMAIVARTSRDEVISALADGANSDKLLYFYCHATSNDNDPDLSAIIMGKAGDRGDHATLRDLNLDAPTDIKLAGRPLVFLNACESADLSPKFYDGFVPFFLAKGARGVIGTESKTPVLFAIHWAEAFIEQLLDGAEVGQIMLELRQQFLRDHGNPLGLLYTIYCDADTRIAPPLNSAS